MNYNYARFFLLYQHFWNIYIYHLFSNAFVNKFKYEIINIGSEIVLIKKKHNKVKIDKTRVPLTSEKTCVHFTKL